MPTRVRHSQGGKLQTIDSFARSKRHGAEHVVRQQNLYLNASDHVSCLPVKHVCARERFPFRAAQKSSVNSNRIAGMFARPHFTPSCRCSCLCQMNSASSFESAVLTSGSCREAESFGLFQKKDPFDWKPPLPSSFASGFRSSPSWPDRPFKSTKPDGFLRGPVEQHRA
jgi:hypothetical protein